MAEIKSLLDGVIEHEIQAVESLASGSDEKSSAIRDLATLHKLRIEEIKAQTEAEEKSERRTMDSEQHKEEIALKKREADRADTDRTREDELQKRQARDQVIDRCVRTGVAVAELVLPLVCYGIWMRKGFQFEETGSFTSTTFKNLLNRFRPTK
jgi:hypothetical protein